MIIFLLLVIFMLLITIAAMNKSIDRTLEASIPLVIADGTCYVLDMERRLGVPLSTLYPILMRLEKRGEIESTAEASGRRAYTFVAAQDRAPNDVHLPSFSRQA